jgi:hypothetical protein
MLKCAPQHKEPFPGPTHSTSEQAQPWQQALVQQAQVNPTPAQPAATTQHPSDCNQCTTDSRTPAVNMVVHTTHNQQHQGTVDTCFAALTAETLPAGYEQPAREATHKPIHMQAAGATSAHILRSTCTACTHGPAHSMRAGQRSTHQPLRNAKTLTAAAIRNACA